MRCYNCGSLLSEHDFCTGCGADVGLYKKILMTSNRFYNDGLAKANVRDLTGAIVCLRQSLKFNKTNIEARNLLGLVYFEMGEVVAALSEWVISKNLQPNKNIADSYISLVQDSGSRLEMINQTIKKYNQALAYCHQDSLDLAVIQLKKVLSMNPRFIRAHQLLALLYINIEDWEKAQRELDKCLAIDGGNTTSLRYKKEVDRMLIPEETGKNAPKRKNEESVRYQSDNEIIIQPANVREPGTGLGSSTIVNILIGIALGVLAAYFLIRPGVIQSIQEEAQEESRAYGEELDAKTARIVELEQQVTDLTEEKADLKGKLEGFLGTDGTPGGFNRLLEAAEQYIENPQDTETLEENLQAVSEEVSIEESSESFQNLYRALMQAAGPEISAKLYESGYEAYSAGDYEGAAGLLERAVFYDPDNGEALFTLGNAYRKGDEKEKAVEVYEKVTELFPGTEKARRSQQYKESLEAE